MKITKATILRTVMLFIVVINYLLTKFGVELIKVSENEVLAVIEMVISVLSIIAAWWYNNSFSEKARRADLFLKNLKEGEI